MSTVVARPYNYIISIDSQGNYRAVSNDLDSSGNPTLDVSDSDPFPVIQAALDAPDMPHLIPEYRPGDIYISAGDYRLNASFPGFNIKPRTRLIFDQNAFITVPYAYCGYVFRLSGNQPGGIVSSYCMIDGGLIREDGINPKRNWTGLLIISETFDKPVLFNKFMNMTINDADVGIRILAFNPQRECPLPCPKVTTCENDPTSHVCGGWVNANSFHNIKMSNNNIFIEFVMDGCYVAGSEQTGIFGNHFESIELTCDQNTTYAIKDIQHKRNFFYNIKVKNLPSTPGFKIANIIDTNSCSHFQIDEKTGKCVQINDECAQINSIISGDMTSTDSNIFPLPAQGTKTLIFDNNFAAGGGGQILEGIKDEIP